ERSGYGGHNKTCCYQGAQYTPWYRGILRIAPAIPRSPCSCGILPHGVPGTVVRPYNAAMNYPYISLKAPAEHLKQLILMRSGLIMLLTAAVLLAHLTHFARLPWVPVLVILAALTLINVLSLLRLKHTSKVTAPELFIQLAIDIITVALIAYYTGGATNPF